jgi:superfamily II DNA helicase RecQ
MIILEDYVNKYIPCSIFCSKTLDGRDTAEWLETNGYKVIRYYDTGRNGLVELSNGLRVSTNGYVSKGSAK